MQTNRLTQVLLAIIALALTAIAIRPYVQPQKVEAQVTNPDAFYFEQGISMLRQQDGGQVLGKVAVNMRTGNVWGFPTSSTDPYPASPLDAKPFISHPILLGKYALSEATK
jgi:hypothetical protein